MPRITTFMAYDDQAEEAAKFYISVFKNSRISTPQGKKRSHRSKMSQGNE